MTGSAKLEVASHYIGEKGQAYFANQRQKGAIGARLDAQKFARFVRPSDCVLDFGCGSGGILANLQAIRKIGIEPNPAAREFCQNEMHGEVSVFASIDQVPDQSVDVAISNHCIEHVPCPIDVLREMYRVLKPGGRLVVFVPIDDWRVQRTYDGKDINHHLHTWSPLTLGHTLFEAGFSNIEASVVTHAFPPRYAWLYQHLPSWMFGAACYWASVLAKRRQVRATALRPK